MEEEQVNNKVISIDYSHGTAGKVWVIEGEWMDTNGKWTGRIPLDYATTRRIARIYMDKFYKGRDEVRNCRIVKYAPA